MKKTPFVPGKIMQPFVLKKMLVFLLLAGWGQSVLAQGKPNILVIWGDDIGITNLSVYSDGLMGYETPNIDRIGNEGIRFLHYYGEQSCTAGRAAFLTGQHGIRSGLIGDVPRGSDEIAALRLLTEG
ncbi:sulfatase-like hydrolase/transferase [Chitinophaga sp.]|uniref:sulfatase-like hydrolase/transferase n=1 Tax=Chitinophaga sp. TaxID=1869181 RepID=UPI002619F1F2|nr:sulfatase-like hydrolase/transferase [uncultured Chitinophaga sp.]